MEETMSKHEQCPVCNSKKATRDCKRINKKICSLCCGRGPRKGMRCPPYCDYFIPPVKPNTIFSEASFTDAETKLMLPFRDNEYIPQIFQIVGLDINQFKILFEDSNSLKILIQGQLVEIIPGIIDHLFEKEEWKKDFIKTESKEGKIKNWAPILSIVRDGNYLIYPDEGKIITKLGQIIDVAVDQHKFFFILPESFPRMAGIPQEKDPPFVLFYGFHSIIYANPLQLKEPFSLEITIHNYGKTFIDGIFCWDIPIIAPFYQLHLKKFIFECKSPFELSNSSELIKICPHIDKKIWGLENMSLFPPPPELADARLRYGKELDKIPLNQLINEELWIEKISGLIFKIRCETNRGFITAVKVTKDPIPIALYEHLEKIEVFKIPLAASFITNNSKEHVTIIISANIDGVTNPETKTIEIGPMKQEIFEHKPHLKLNSRIRNETFLTYLQIEISKVTENGNIVLMKNTYPIRILANDTMIWKASFPNGITQDLVRYIACWVTPNRTEFDNLIRNAVQRIGHGAFTGYIDSEKHPEFIRDQVKALYDELSSIPLKYVGQDFTFGSSTSQITQKVFKPIQTLKKGFGNCIDFAVLMASLLESVNIHPIIVFIENHAFLGWEIEENTEKYEFLECTDIGITSFEEAMKDGAFYYREEYLKTHSELNQIVNIRKMRAKGIYPLTDD